MINQREAEPGADITATTVKTVTGLHGFHWLIIASSLVLTFFAWYFSSKQIAAKTDQQFSRQADQVIELVTERMRHYEDALWGGVAAMRLQAGSMDHEKWQRFAETLRVEQRYPGINGVGVIFHVEPTSISQFVRREREKRPDFSVRPKHNNPIYLPITYIEPLATNRQALGLDVAHETNRLTAALKARDTGQATITGPIVLVQDSEKTPGFLFYAPFYQSSEVHSHSTISSRREHFVGLVYAPFIFKNLLEGTLDKAKRAVNLRIEDQGVVLYDEQNNIQASERRASDRYQTDRYVDIYGRQWLFSIWGAEDFVAQNSSNQPMVILVGGITIDILLFLLFFAMAKSNRRAVSLAQKMTRRYQAKTEQLEAANTELEEFSYRTSHDLRSPLISSIGLLDVAEKAIDNQQIDRAKLSIHHTTQSLKKLQELVTGILDLAKITHLEEESTTINVKALVNDAIASLSHMSNADRIDYRLGIDDNLTVSVKKLRLQLIIENLLSNAIKYQNEAAVESWVAIDAALEGKMLRLSVEDNGLGIPKNLQSDVFTMFKRFHTTVSYGSGLGLYMVKKSVRLLGGDITFVEGDGGVGARFVLAIAVD